jgi:HEAT repeat protein
MTRSANADPYEPYLHRRLLAQGQALVADLRGPAPPADTVLPRLLDLMIHTQVKALGDAAGAVLAAALRPGGGAGIRAQVLTAIAAGVPLWRFRALSADPAIQGALLARLADPDPHVRTAAIKALAAAVALPAVRLALQAGLGDPRPHVRSTAALALAPALADPAVYEAVVALRQDPKSGVQRAGRRALQQAARTPRVYARLVAHLPQIAPADLWYIADALAACPPPAALHHWVLAQLRDPARHIIWDGFPIVRALAGRPEIRDRLLPYLGTGEAFTTQRAVWILGPHAADPVVRAALLAHAEDPVYWVRAAVVQMLAPHSADPAVQARLRRRCTDPQPGLRAAAVEALAPQARHPTVAAMLRPRLHDPDLAVQVAAVAALSAVEPGPALWAVLEPLIARRPNLSQEALAAVGPLAQDPAVRAYLGRLLADPEAAIRRAAARALSGAQPEAALREALGARCADPNAWVADAAYTTLVAWATREATG